MQTTPSPADKIVVYGHGFCPQARLMAQALAKHQVSHEWRDIHGDNPAYQTELKRLAHGNLSVPTVVFADGSVLVEAWPNQVLKKLRLKKPNFLERFIGRLRDRAG